MKDFTKDSISNHLLIMAAPVAANMLAQIAYQLVDIYFVSKIGVAATAGVNAAGNAIFVIVALTQVLAVGTVALVAHAVGRKDQADANLVFNQSMTLSLASGLMTIVLLRAFMRPYLQSVAADVATIDAGITFILWVLPAYALMFPWAATSSSLRGIGIVQPTIVIYVITVIINALLAPIFIAGWGTGVALGVKGAGLATSISVVIGVILLGLYFGHTQHYLTIKPKMMRPQFLQWRRILDIGLPAGGEFTVLFLSTAMVYYVIRHFGASAQAGFGIGSRVLQVILLPAMSIAFAAGPIAGQNFGARNSGRVKETFRKAALMGTAMMVVATILVQWRPQAFVGIFATSTSTVAVAALFLQLMSSTFVAQALVFTCSIMFQSLGNTMPSLISAIMRFFAFSIPALWLSMQPSFRIEHVWYLSIASVALQTVVSLWLLRMEFKKLSLRMAL